MTPISLNNFERNKQGWLYRRHDYVLYKINNIVDCKETWYFLLYMRRKIQIIATCTEIFSRIIKKEKPLIDTYMALKFRYLFFFLRINLNYANVFRHKFPIDFAISL